MIMNSKIFGKGMPVLILHGLFGMGDNWTTLGKKLAENQREVHLLDLRNHGKSAHKENMGYELLSQDILRYIEHYKLTPPVLLGHSMGGKAAMHFGLHCSENTKALIVVDISPKAYPPHHQKIIECIKRIPIKSIKSRGDLDRFLQKNTDDPSIWKLLSKNAYRSEEGDFAFRFYLQGIENSYKELMSAQNTEKTYDKRALFLRGANSDYIRKEDFLQIDKLFTRSQIVTIPHAGHWAHADNPYAVYKNIDLFLKYY